MIGLALAAQLAFSAQTATAPLPQGRVMIRLVGQQHDISVLATNHGVRYAALDPSGRLIVSGATLEDLKDQHPDLYERIAPTLCDAQGVPVILAGM